MSDDLPPLLDDPRWSLEDSRIASGRSGDIAARPDELAALAKDLDLVSLDALTLTYSVKPSAGGFRLKAAIKADATQACVVTGAPLPEKVRETLDLDLVPEDPAHRPKSDEQVFDPLDDSAPETYAGGRIDLGQFAFEMLATGLDPYPRAPGAHLPEAGEGDTDKPNPFAALKSLKPKAES